MTVDTRMTINPDSLPNDPLRRLVAIMAALRGPEGCPWDREQDHRSLRSNLLEETYEVLDVLDRAGEIDSEKLVEELGDLLLQIVFHAQLGTERDDFDLDAIASAINEKLIHRHPHVFATTVVSSSYEVLRNWERLKHEEGKHSTVEGIPGSLPALLRTAHLLSRAERIGFKWRSRQEALAKVREEWKELEAAVARAEEEKDGAIPEIEREFGDVVLAMVSVVLAFDVDPEAALREASRRFETRFRRMEDTLAEQGKSLHALEFSKLLDFWNASRREHPAQDAGNDSDS